MLREAGERRLMPRRSPIEKGRSKEMRRLRVRTLGAAIAVAAIVLASQTEVSDGA